MLTFLLMSKKLRTLYSVLIPAALLLSTAVVARMDLKQDIRNTPRYTVVAGSAPSISDNITYENINRESVLIEFFEKYDSPLKDHTDTFIAVADKYDIDYRLLPAISCIESGCGKKLIADSYNPFGWGIYGNKVTRFANYDEAIEKVGEGLNKNYFAKGFDTIEEIAPIYTPSSHVHWLSKVRFFMSQIEINTPKI